MGKGQDANNAVKKEPVKTVKEKKAEKILKKSKKGWNWIQCLLFPLHVDDQRNWISNDHQIFNYGLKMLQ